MSLRSSPSDRRGRYFDLRRARQIWDEETRFFQPILLLASGIAKMIPPYVGGRLRVRILRAIGFKVGQSTLCDVPTMYGSGKIRRRLTIGSGVFINFGCTFDLSDQIVIGDDVSLGHEVMILTSSHVVGQQGHRAADLTHAPVIIGRGAWIGSRVLILPGVRIGTGAVVAAGAVVLADLPANSMSAGVPAQVKVELGHLRPRDPNRTSRSAEMAAAVQLRDAGR